VNSRQRNLARLLAPKSVAVVGASSDPAKAGSQALRSLSLYAGSVAGVHPREKSVDGVPFYPTLTAIPQPPDLAILAIPADRCCDAAEEAAACGVGGILIISGGFGEIGDEGMQRQQRLLEICRSTGLRMLGPNTSGFVNRPVDCVACFVPGMDRLRTGRVAVVAQSGGVNISVSFLLDRLGAGVSLAVGLGNAVDVDAADILEWLAQDPHTASVALHLEGVGNGRRLSAGSRAAECIKCKNLTSVGSFRAQLTHQSAFFLRLGAQNVHNLPSGITSRHFFSTERTTDGICSTARRHPGHHRLG